MRTEPRFRPPDGFFRTGPRSSLVASVVPREIGFDDDEYPPGVRQMEDPPPRLWAVGRDLRSFGSMVTIIGARRATTYGLSIAHRLAGDLAVGGVCIVSGMARGCDAAAHDGALDAGGATIAVLGSGADVCYPRGSRTLYAEIAATGAIVSANPPGHVPYRHDFPRRNGIMVAMSVAVVVVQGDGESAAVKTGKEAAGRGKGNVFAVPGAIGWPQSEGVHEMLRVGAAVCTQAADIKNTLRDDLQWSPPDVRPVPDHLPPPQRAVLTALGRGPMGREELIAESGLAAAAASVTISELELRGYIVEEGFLLRRVR